jgi:hypothetical protein
MVQKPTKPLIEGEVLESGTEQVDDQGKKVEPYAWLGPSQFRKGQSGNPSGRPPDLLGRELRKQFDAHPEDVERIVGVLIAHAKVGNLKAIQMIWDRTAGKLTPRVEQQIAVTTQDGFVGIKVLKGVDPDAV